MGSVLIGRYVLRVGDPAGAAVEAAGDGVEGDAAALASALEAPAEEGARTVGEVAAGAVDDASAVTAKTERAIALGEGVAEGRVLDPDQLSLEADSLLGLLERLDREGRWEEQLRLARALSNLLSLLKRWAALLRTLRAALRAGERLGDLDGIAWAKHEMGTLRVAAEDVKGAERDLREAAEIRERIGDRRGLGVTNRNLGTLCDQLRRLLREDRLRQGGRRFPRRLVAVAAAALVLGGGAGVAAGSGLGGGSGGPAAPPGSTTARSQGTGTGGTTNGIGNPTTRTGGETNRNTNGTTGGSTSGTGEGTGGTTGETTGPTTGELVQRSLEVTAVGRGSVSVGEIRFGCKTECTRSFEFEDGSEVSVSAEAGERSVLVGFTGACSGAEECVVTMDGDRQLTVRFASEKELRRELAKPPVAGRQGEAGEATTGQSPP